MRVPPKAESDGPPAPTPVIRVDIDKEMRYLIQCSTQSRKVMQFYGPSNVEVDNQVKAHICALIGIEP